MSTTSFSKSCLTVFPETKAPGNSGCWSQMSLRLPPFQIMRRRLTQIQILGHSSILVLSVQRERIELCWLQSNLLRRCLVMSMLHQLLINYRKFMMNLSPMSLCFTCYQLELILLILLMNLVRKRKLLQIKLVWVRNRKLKLLSRLIKPLLMDNGLFFVTVTCLLSIWVL